MASARLRFELRSIVLDVLGLGEPRDLPQEVSAWVEAAAEAAVSAVCDSSVRGLMQSIDASIAAAPPAVVARLAQSAIRRDVGVD